MELEPQHQANIQNSATETAKYAYAVSSETEALKVAQEAFQYKSFNKSSDLNCRVFVVN